MSVKLIARISWVVLATPALILVEIPASSSADPAKSRIAPLNNPQLSGNSEPAEDGAKTARRRYEDGPLTLEDFQAKPPEIRPTTLTGRRVIAWTSTEVRFNYRYSFKQRRSDRAWTGRITSFECFSVVERDKSWNLVPNSQRILDHEQGHFDLTEISARRGQGLFEKCLADGSLLARGESEADVKQKLDQAIQVKMQKVLEDARGQQNEYDRVTSHGLDLESQAAARESQRRQLAESKGRKPGQRSDGR